MGLRQGPQDSNSQEDSKKRNVAREEPSDDPCFAVGNAANILLVVAMVVYHSFTGERACFQTERGFGCWICSLFRLAHTVPARS